MITTVSPIEAVWTLVTLFGCLVALGNLSTALRTRRIIADGPPPVDDGERLRLATRRLVARSTVRREAVRLVISGSLFVLVIPALLRPGDTPLSWGLVAIMLVPIGMSLNSYLDRRDRQALQRIVEAFR